MSIENSELMAENKVHSMASLNDYDLFHDRDNKIIESAFIITPNQFFVTLKIAEQISLNTIRLYYYDYNSIDENGNFNKIKISIPVFIQKGNQLFFETAGFDLTKNYFVEIYSDKSNLFLDPTIGGIIDYYFDAGNVSDLGVTYKGSAAIFKLWSPSAGRVVLKIFDKDQKPVKAISDLELRRGDKGLWAYELVASDLENIKSLEGLFYQYEVYAYGKKTTGLDPYAKSMAAFDSTGVDAIGKGAIVGFWGNQSKPEKFEKLYKNSHHIANDIDLIVYEVHVRDFTIQPGLLKPEIAGTFKGFIEKIDYLKSLGITHVQLLPVANYYTVNEGDRSYKGSDAKSSNYNWGYDPHNYFTPEGQFSTNANNPYSRIIEFRELIQALHDKGIGVIMDVVYNHTYTIEVFENIAPGCYFRYNKSLKISGTTGAGPTFECRHKMAKKLMIESMKHFVEQYHVDGFRFDLMSFFDHETILEIRNEVGAVYNKDNINELILQGEAWTFSDIDIDINAKGNSAATTKLNYPDKKINLGIFNDSSRDSYTGRENNRGFVHGVLSDISRVVTGIAGALKKYDVAIGSIDQEVFNDNYNKFGFYPENCLNYLTIHDGYTLWDKLNLTVKDESKLVRARLMRMANAMLFTSQGKIIMHGGDEILRTKPLSLVDKERHRAYTSENVSEEEGTKYFHENTYCSNDFTNMIRWDRLENSYSEIATSMLEYYKGLIEMRRNIPAFRYNSAESVIKGLCFIDTRAKKNSDSAFYKDFNDPRLDKFVLKFINGPKNEKLYIAGEVHSNGFDVNPLINKYVVNFDEKGQGEIQFDRKQISSFQMSKWGIGNGLNIKLVKEPGNWDTIDGAYSADGNNLITINSIDNNFESSIDLSIIDCNAANVTYSNNGYIAFTLDNTLENDLANGFKGTDFKTLLVIFNSNMNAVIVSNDVITDASHWSVIVDDHNAGIKPLQYSKEITTKLGMTNVLIEKGYVIVPGQSCTVVAK